MVFGSNRAVTSHAKMIETGQALIHALFVIKGGHHGRNGSQTDRATVVFSMPNEECI